MAARGATPATNRAKAAVRQKSLRLWFPTIQDILEAHDRVITRTGGDRGLLNRGSLENAVERARWGPFDGVGDVFERAAMIVRAIGLDHPFADGNKRTAFEAADTFLRKNGIEPNLGTEEGIEFMLRVARAELELADIADWLRAHGKV